MDPSLLTLLDELEAFGETNDARETARQHRMLNITSDTGRLLWILVRLVRPRHILEIGTSNGYSTIWLADSARAIGARVATLEIDPAKATLARAHLARAGLADVVDVIEGPATASLARLAGPFELVFLDADRESYLTYLEALLPKMPSHALLVADNAVSHAAELTDYLERLRTDPDFFAVTVPVGKGESIALKLR
jgi:predicted O-methyltransferase YrrM